jgi:protein-S-isoprenylcysteine O-methyltransferase Ste14
LLPISVYVAGALIFIAAAAFVQRKADPSRITLQLIALIEIITAGLNICTRRAQRCDWRPLFVTASFIAMPYFLALDPKTSSHLVPEFVGAGLQIIGLFFQFYAKLTLCRSFGILAAARSLVTHGAYRGLRHPVYFGYMIGHLGFLISGLRRNDGRFEHALVLPRKPLAGRAAQRNLQNPIPLVGARIGVLPSSCPTQAGTHREHSVVPA